MYNLNELAAACKKFEAINEISYRTPQKLGATRGPAGSFDINKAIRNTDLDGNIEYNIPTGYPKRANHWPSLEEFRASKVHLCKEYIKEGGWILYMHEVPNWRESDYFHYSLVSFSRKETYYFKLLKQDVLFNNTCDHVTKLCWNKFSSSEYIYQASVF